jgi:pimeloyl-ACP methyl ester carboxylesterase
MKAIRSLSFLVILSLATIASGAQKGTQSKSDDPAAFWDPTSSDHIEKTGRYSIICPGLPTTLWNSVAVPLGQKPLDPRELELCYRYGSDKEDEKGKAKNSAPLETFLGEPVGFTVYAPSEIESREPLGLVVHISHSQTTPDGNMGHPFKHAVDARRLVMIAANRAGNPDSISWRVMCAVAATELAKRRYNIQAERVYLTGVSGGGLVTSYAMLRYPDIFCGAMPIVGMNPLSEWESTNIPSAVLGKFYKSTRLAVLEGSKDYNRDQAKEAFSFYKPKMSLATYIEDPNGGHGVPDTEYLDRALDFMDAPLLIEGANVWSKVEPKLQDPKRKAEVLAALRPYRGVMYNQQWGAKALDVFNSLNTAYLADYKRAEDSVASQDSKEAIDAISHLISTWGVAAKDDAIMLRKKMGSAKTK